MTFRLPNVYIVNTLPFGKPGPRACPIAATVSPMRRPIHGRPSSPHPPGDPQASLHRSVVQPPVQRGRSWQRRCCRRAHPDAEQRTRPLRRCRGIGAWSARPRRRGPRTAVCAPMRLSLASLCTFAGRCRRTRKASRKTGPVRPSPCGPGARLDAWPWSGRVRSRRSSKA